MDRFAVRGAGDHVARVLHVAGRVGDDELALGRGEIAIGHVNRDALFALGAQAVGEVGQVDLAAAGDVGGVPAPRSGLPSATWNRKAGRPMSVDLPSSTLPQVLKRT
jgi:hypothetical protein